MRRAGHGFTQRLLRTAPTRPIHRYPAQHNSLLTRCLLRSKHSKTISRKGGDRVRILQYVQNEKNGTHHFVAVDANKTFQDEDIVIPLPPNSAWTSEIYAPLADFLETFLSDFNRTSPTSKPQRAFDLNVIDAAFRAFASNRPLQAKAESTVPALLTWMITNGRRKAALQLTEAILKQVSLDLAIPRLETPSNILWPGPQTKSISRDRSEYELEHLTYSVSSVIDPNLHFDVHPTTPNLGQNAAHNILNSIWVTLGQLVILSAHAEDQEASNAISAALIVIAQLHNRELLPDNIYEHMTSPHASVLQRPPILHLMSSRILTAVSDAVWRDQQDDAIAKAANLGMTMRELGRHPPGGRFRLKVRPLGAEVWMEFIMWCCIDSGYTSAAVELLQALKRVEDDPWFAVSWTQADSITSKNHIRPRIDWDRISMRTGGVVGRIEGYSHETPLVEIPLRTISSEVVLALIEALIDRIVLSQDASDPTRLIKASMTNIREVASFLEPHDLPSSYFDYLATRLYHTDTLDPEARPELLQYWTECLGQIEKLESRLVDEPKSPDLALGCVLDRSLTQVALKQQVLDSLVQMKDVHRSLEVFNDIQEYSDLLKLQSTQEFIHNSIVNERLQIDKLPEYVGSHGQLPCYRLAPLLDMASENGMQGLASWFLDAQSLDGPLIPREIYSNRALASALYRTAGRAADRDLLERVLFAQQAHGLSPNVGHRRTLVGVYLDWLDFGAAHSMLSDLRDIKHGGVGLSNIVQAAALIMRLEGDLSKSQKFIFKSACQMLRDMLQGKYDTKRGDYVDVSTRLYRQQVGNIVRVLNLVEGSKVREIAQESGSIAQASNLVKLPPYLFNPLFETFIQQRGVAAGYSLWVRFCSDPVDQLEGGALIADDMVLSEESEGAGEDFETSSTTSNPVPKDYVRLEEPELLDVSEGFENPYFRDAADDAPDAVDIDDERSMAYDPYSNTAAYDTLNAGDIEDEPFITTNLQSLRLLVRAAVAEKEAATDALYRSRKSANMRLASDIVLWATQMLKRLGLSRRTVEQEVEQSFTEDMLVAYQENTVIKPQVPERTHFTGARSIPLEKDIRRSFSQPE